jgi:SAM-dependent methyltransferase
MSRSRAPRPLVEIRSHVSAPPSEVFPLFWAELSSSLLQRGWLIAGERDGQLRSAEDRKLRRAGAQVVRWDPPRQVEVVWDQGAVRKGPPPRLRVRCEGEGSGTTIVVEHGGGTGLRGGPREEQGLGWLTSEVVTPLLLAVAPARLVAWSEDRSGRRPSGPTSKRYWKEPVYHLPGFRAILEGLALRKDDVLLEVGCGGGALLKRALATGCRAAAVDHSADMLKVASQQNARAIAAGHLQLRLGEATALPFPNEQFTCAVMSGVLAWLPAPEKAFREVFRTLRPGGRFVAWTSTPKMYGTPAAGAKRKGGVRFYEDRVLARFVRSAGYSDVRIDHPDLRADAKEVGVPVLHRFLFGPDYGTLIWARRS